MSCYCFPFVPLLPAQGGAGWAEGGEEREEPEGELRQQVQLGQGPGPSLPRPGQYHISASGSAKSGRPRIRFRITPFRTWSRVTESRSALHTLTSV
jgi:hypothetical protein